VEDVDLGVCPGRWCAGDPTRVVALLALVFLKHKLLDDPMIKPNSRRRTRLVFQKHKVWVSIDLLRTVAVRIDLFVAAFGR
jgi:hypothetical protein